MLIFQSMIDPGWVAAGLVVIVNGVGWVVNYSHGNKEQARREGEIIAHLDDLSQRVDRLEQRFNECFNRAR